MIFLLRRIQSIHFLTLSFSYEYLRPRPGPSANREIPKHIFESLESDIKLIAEHGSRNGVEFNVSKTQCYQNYTGKMGSQ